MHLRTVSLLDYKMCRFQSEEIKRVDPADLHVHDAGDVDEDFFSTDSDEDMDENLDTDFDDDVDDEVDSDSDEDDCSEEAAFVESWLDDAYFDPNYARGAHDLFRLMKTWVKIVMKILMMRMMRWTLTQTKMRRRR